MTSRDPAIDDDEPAVANGDGRGGVLRTARLSLCPLRIDDAGFVLELVNEPAWLQFIGDRGVRTLDDACDYIRTGPMAMTERHGHGLRLVRRRPDDVPMGLCGLLRRDTLDSPDIGFAFSPAFWGQGYAFEAAQATLDDARRTLGMARVLAIVSPHNVRSIRLLERLGLSFESMMRLSDDADEVARYATSPGRAPVAT